MVLVFLMLDYSAAGEAFCKPALPPHRLIGRDVRGKLRLRLINASGASRTNSEPERKRHGEDFTPPRIDLENAARDHVLARRH